MKVPKAGRRTSYAEGPASLKTLRQVSSMYLWIEVRELAGEKGKA